MADLFLYNSPKREKVPVGVGPFYEFHGVFHLPTGKAVEKILG
jgi:hypothetical protein